MRLSIAIPKWALAVTCGMGLALPPGLAQEESQKPSPQGPVGILYLGMPANVSETDRAGQPLNVYEIETLPAAEDAADLVTATLLRNRAVSRINSQSQGRMATRSGEAQFFTITDITLASASNIAANNMGGSDTADDDAAEDDMAAPTVTAGFTAALGDEEISAHDLGTGLDALIGAFGPEGRNIGFARIHDPEDVFPAKIDAVQAMFAQSNFNMWVLTVAGPGSEECGVTQDATLPLALISGVADREPFGDGDATTSFDEAEGFVTRALSRQIARDDNCGTAYAVVFGEGGNVASHAEPVFFEALEADLLIESFEADYLVSSDSAEEIRGFLQACIYCPEAGALEQRLSDIGRQTVLAGVEDRIWEQVIASPDPRRLQVYLDRCNLCENRDEAEAMLGELNAAEAARDAEAASFAALDGSGDLAGLKAYVAECVACDFKAEAEAQIEGIETQAAFQEEQAAREAAVNDGGRVALSAWLESCNFCEGRDEIEAQLATLESRDALAGPCLAAASVPQFGGPRLLNQIDVAEAKAACGTALEAFPNDAEFITLSGRVDHAAGNVEQADAAYAQGIEAGLPMAHGLAGHLRFEPPAGSNISQDFDEAERLAVIGAAQGDWLSKQLLSVLYSQSLIPGKSAADALPLAESAANEGDPVSQFFMGFFNLSGAGLDGVVDTEAAEEWFSKSAAQGYLPANTFLAETLEAKIDEDPEAAERAATLLLEAVTGGDAGALTRLTTGLRDRNSDVIRAVQTLLQEQGFYEGGIDGDPGRETLRAIEAFANQDNAAE